MNSSPPYHMSDTLYMKMVGVLQYSRHFPFTRTHAISSRIRSLLCTYIASFSKKQCVLHTTMSPHNSCILNVSNCSKFCFVNAAQLHCTCTCMSRQSSNSPSLPTDSVRTCRLTISQAYIHTYLLLRSFSMSAKTFSMCLSSGDMFKSWFSCCTCSGSAAFWT